MQWWLHRAAQARFTAGDEVVEIRRGPDGHYHWPGRVNGREVDFLIDTGATGTAIPGSLARALRLEAIGTIESNTAGGPATGQLVVADIALRGGLEVKRLHVAALPGLEGHPLLGMDLLGRLHWQQSDGVLRIDLRTVRR